MIRKIQLSPILANLAPTCQIQANPRQPKR